MGAWIKVLEEDPLEIFRAAADAEKIQKHLCSLQQQQSIADGISLADAIKEYERRVDGPEARKQLEQINPQLVAARDKAVAEMGRAKLQDGIAANQMQTGCSVRL